MTAAYTCTYDVWNRLVEVKDGANVVAQYRCDALGRMTRITQAGTTGGAAVAEKRVDFGYNALGQYDTVSRFADLAGTEPVVETAFDYDLANRLTGLTHTHDSSTLAACGLTVDAAGQVTAFSGEDEGSGAATATYDNTGQLTGVDHQSLDDESYAYDENGNRTGTGCVTATDNRLESDGTYTYDYDAEGNLIGKTKTNVTGNEVKYTTYSWDYRNRLTEIVSRNSSEEVVRTVEYTYDAFDRRITKEVLDGDDETVLAERFVYDGNAIVLVLDGGGAVEERYLQGPGIDQPLAEEDVEGDVRWFLADHLGTVRDVVDSDGALLNHVVYDTFGNVLSQTDAGEQPRFAFAGRELDAESGLYYNRLRYYDPAAGRFISEDPIGFAGGDGNLYRYVGNSPLNFIDPMGLSSVPPEVAKDPTEEPYVLGDSNTQSATVLSTLGVTDDAEGQHVVTVGVRKGTGYNNDQDARLNPRLLPSMTGEASSDRDSCQVVVVGKDKGGAIVALDTNVADRQARPQRAANWNGGEDSVSWTDCLPEEVTDLDVLVVYTDVIRYSGEGGDLPAIIASWHVEIRDGRVHTLNNTDEVGKEPKARKPKTRLEKLANEKHIGVVTLRIKELTGGRLTLVPRGDRMSGDSLSGFDIGPPKAK